MSRNFQKLLLAYETAYDLNLKKKYSIPKIYDANGDITQRWYVYFSFRNPITGYLERQPTIDTGLNQFKNLKDRRAAAKVLRDAVEAILKNGYDPYFDENIGVDEVSKYNIPEAVNFVLEIKEKTRVGQSFTDFKSRIKRFEKWLLENGFQNRYITTVNKKTVINYLNTVLLSSSGANRNNTRSAISQFYKTLLDNDVVPENFISKIDVIKIKPERNKTYTLKQEGDLFQFMEENDLMMLLYIQIISYNHLRPIEVVRLRIKDVDPVEKRLYVQAKNKLVKIKIIPDKLLQKLPDLTNFDPESFLFTPEGFGFPWATKETDKRGYFSKRFGKIKKKFNLGSDYGMYSFRHTFITKLYRELVKDSTPFEAKSKLMLITGHTTMNALEKYLRDIDAELPDDYSEFIK